MMRWLRCSYEELLALPREVYDVAIEEATREANEIKAARRR